MVTDGKWKKLLNGFRKAVDKFSLVKSGSSKKRKRSLRPEVEKAWSVFSLKLQVTSAQINDSSGMVFSFVEGAFVSALRTGEWILLDEVNLAPPETLQRIIGVLEDENGSFCLAERGDVEHIHRHPNFRLFACMNPATDAGKRDLPFSLRSKFTEYFFDDVVDDNDLILFINQFMDDEHAKNGELVKKIASFYKAARKISEERLQDGANQKPQYSLRSLYRALEYVRKARRKFGFNRALYDGFCMFFLTLLDTPSAKSMNQMISSYLMDSISLPQISFENYVVVERNCASVGFVENYVLTETVRKHLKDLARAIFVGRYPVLLQGPTSSGKTSLVQYLAAITGHEFVRINNHEHTDLQEYLGSYITDSKGKLVFQEGVLVKAVRHGHWIVLDELNLAPSDVLEALNRLLDDNRELFVPELQETIHAHPDFMLFATQNPPTIYGGRKILSRAFRNRFVEIHVDEIPEKELSTILQKRYKVPEKYAKKMVEVMKELQLRRQGSKVFAGKHGFITPRDLFRWAIRFMRSGEFYEASGGTSFLSHEVLAQDGYFLLAERLRDEGEKKEIQEVLEKWFGAKLAVDDIYNQKHGGRDFKSESCSANPGNVVWTRSMWRLYFLIKRCYEMREPVLLIGETGGGKTTVCQLLSSLLGSNLKILNCHRYSETSDFLGGFHPIRDRSKVALDFSELCEKLMQSKPLLYFPDEARIPTDIRQASSTLQKLGFILDSYKQGRVTHPEVTLYDLNLLEQLNQNLADLQKKWLTIFMWEDGSLVQAMKQGDLFLVDEISLADDSVLERLNSVLEPERKLALAEKGGSDLEIVTAHENFLLLATMNPGGDYGKKELSPALRNRFTEIWVPHVGDIDELRDIALWRIHKKELSYIVEHMLNFWKWFNELQTGKVLTVRDLLSWIDFINSTEGILQPDVACLHGLFLVLLDGLSLGTGIVESDAGELRGRCFSFLSEQLKADNYSSFDQRFYSLENYNSGDLGHKSSLDCMECDDLFGISPFYISKGNAPLDPEGFEFSAKTTCKNALRVLRALQLQKPVLLEGSPGVGKTSLIMALGKYSQHTVVRINLSEQTDLMDLLGSDLPVESDDGLQFAWSDGILLQALKNGYWVLLDELNLASQSVLEGLNAILDHRAEVFIPELGITYKCPPSFRVFACQNPSYQGGGRKELPKSFLNRFAKVYVDQLAEEDYKFISSSLFPSISESLLDKIIHFNKRLCEDIMKYRKFGQGGSPWEFNLRDVVRLCQLIQGAPKRSRIDSFINTIYIKRMRKDTDRKEILKLFFEIFGVKPSLNPYPRVQLTPGYLIVGDIPIERSHVQLSKSLSSELKLLPGIRHNLEAVSTCVQQGWLCILVGSPSSGKTSLIRLLSELTGNVLNELNLSSATDISELLGCFELQQEDSSGKSNSAKFEWVTGVLVKAVESGEWIILENANLCNPTVLDRINSLVESSGSITINECGTLDGKPKVIYPHPKFRMFLTVDPSYGEISRAMRNRGVEVYMMPPHWLLNDANNDNGDDDDELNDVRQFLILSGVPFDLVVDSMAKSHLYTKDEGLFLNVSITYLELGRWVQLLKQLLAGGGQLVWSLQTSWEYTYISSLGKARGKDILSHVMHTFLSVPKLYVDSGSPCLPGGWPSPLQIRDFVQYSREASIRQNCMYLEYLGAQCASSMHSSSHVKSQIEEAIGPYLMNMKMLKMSMFPNSDCSHHRSQEEGGLVLTKRRFMLAANWTIEQATEHDLQLYLHWFSWFALQLTQETGHFFISFLSSLQEELKHPIWKSIFKCRHKLLSHHKVDLESWPIPMLSLDLVDLSEDKVSQSTDSNNMLESQNELLNSIRCISLLRVTFQQWIAEEERHINFQQWKIDSLFEYSYKDQCLKRFLLAVRKLEENLLNGLVQSPEFSSLVQLYAGLVEEHVSFWTSITSGQSENLQMSWHSLLKRAGKLHYLFPDEVVALLMESKKLKGETSWGHYLQKSLLWVHGGHPLVASSSVMHTNQSQLLRLCELVWPSYAKKRNSVTDESFITGAVSSIPGLRRLALEGISMSTYVMTNIEESDPVDQLEEMYQVLVKRLAHEKDQLKAVSDASKCPMSLANLTSCCILSPKILCRKFGFDGWQDTLPIVEKAAFLFDLQLLKKLSDFVLFNGNKDCSPDPSTLSDQLESCLNFSLDFSSRPPITLAPHQKILWTLDVLATSNEGNTKVASFVLEMWFCWHSLIWNLQPAETKGLANINIEDMLLPDALFKSIRLSTTNRILQSEPSVNDYPMYCWKLRLVSHYLWRSFLPVTDVQNNLYCAALSLFQQIIYAHEKSFCANDFVLIKSILCSSQKNLKTQDDTKKLLSLLESSSHPGLVSLLEPFVKPIVDELYLKHSLGIADSIYGLGCAWLHLGVIRYHLLILCDDMDPTVKYSSKYQKLLEKVALLELDIKVREDCVYLAGSFAQREAEERRTRLANLKDECRRFQRKVVYRSDPGKFLELKNICSEFLKMIMPSFDLIKNVKSIDTQILMEQMRNWQVTSTNFISRLSTDYAAYIDIIQPVQIAVYEMKLGLSLVLSSVIQEKYLERIGVGNMNQVEESVYAFVRFPRGFALKTLSFDFDLISESMITSHHIVSPISVNELDVNFLENMVASSSDVHSDNMQELILPLKADIYQNILVRAANSITDSQLMDDESFAFLEKTFEKFASLWVDMKVQIKARESDENRQYIFKPRAFNIRKIIEIDRSIIDSPFGEDMSSEWKEMISEEELNAENAPEEYDTLEDEWKFIEESLLNNLVNIHNQLFGSKDLLHTAGYFKVSEAERLTSFLGSYRLGAKMSTDMNGPIYANLDARLVPEQMLHLCLEHEQKFNISCSFDRPYSFYKDSNAAELAKIVEPVTSLQRSIMTLLNEWDNHYALQKIKDITQKILEFPLSTPLHKALSGLRFLYNTVRGVQDTVAKFPLSGELASIVQLAFSWQKLEYEYWPAMFDEVEKQFDVNASKLWFPLYSVLKQKYSKDLIEHNRITIESLKAFMETSSVGEFRRRIQLLFAMHGYIKTGICRGLFSSSYYEENLKIMYNMFGFYVQHLPIVLEHIDLNKKTIQSELKKVLKLCKWDHPERSMSIDDSKRTKQKLRKLIQKYTDVLQKPIMLIINQGALKRGMAVQTSPKYPIPDLSKRAEERFSWFIEWKRKVSEKLLYLASERHPDFEILNACLKESALSECFSSNSSCIALKEENLGIWTTIDTILQTAVSCNELWIGEGKSLGKRRALSEFLKLLDSCGLFKHRSSLIKDQELDQSNWWWLFQSSYDISHLLSTQDGLPSEEDVSAVLSQALNLPSQNVAGLWEATNKFYFRSISSVTNLLSVSLNFHKDFTQEQVIRSCSFLNHLVVIQQEHRAAAYAFAENLGHLKKWVLHFENLYSGSQNDGNSPFSDKQHLTFTCMWQQKQVFDSLCSMTSEECLLLKIVENNHLATCETVKVTAHNTRLFIEEYLPIFQRSKDLLDSFLLGHNRMLPSSSSSLHPYGVSKQMELLVLQNFREVELFEKQVYEIDEDRASFKNALLLCYQDIFNKVHLISSDYSSNTKRTISIDAEKDIASSDELEAAYDKALKETYKHMIDVFKCIASWSTDENDIDSFKNITLWKKNFASRVTILNLDFLNETLMKLVCYAGKLVNHCAVGSRFHSIVGLHLKHVSLLLESLVNLGDSLLGNFQDIQRTVSLMTCLLANVFASLYTQGFGQPSEDETTEAGDGNTQEAKGTGMGDGAGKNDVSDQITDEDQLLGASDQPDAQDASNQVPNDKPKGIEMEQDFEADTFSMNEESGDDNDEDDENTEEEQLDSAMDKTGSDNETIAEKLWDKNDDIEEKPDSKKEKYEMGPSIKDTDSSNRELRAKDDNDSSPADNMDADDSNPDKTSDGDDLDDDNENEDPLDGDETPDDMNIDKQDAFTDSLGLKMDEHVQVNEEDKMIEEETNTDQMEDANMEEIDEPDDNRDDNRVDEEDKAVSADEYEEGGDNEKGDKNLDTDEPAENNPDKNTEMDLVSEKPYQPSYGNPSTNITSAESLSQPMADSCETGAIDSIAETKWSSGSEIQNDFAPMRGPNASDMEKTMTDPSETGKMNDQPQSQPSQPDLPSQKMQSNPCRSIGDALKDWKERVSVSVDIQDNQLEDESNVMEEDNINEYGYTQEFDKGTDQALGPATSEQMKNEISGERPEGDSKAGAERDDHIAPIQVDKNDDKPQPPKNSASRLVSKINELQMKPEGTSDAAPDHDASSGNRFDRSQSESLVSMKKSFLNDDIRQFTDLSLDDNDHHLGNANIVEHGMINSEAVALWKKYEMRTTRSAQELVEQLRMVMEPTRASKLQGDYKTGKRINMKKVIPYIASHYRKDKIWLRRTRPDKRNYQVVIAMDDSQSMSESHCGDVAIEALVTVCRAMSQLEVGDLSVASFGKEGNIQLLHEFGKPFTQEAGVKVISSLTFNQENTIADEPMVDLLRYLNNMLDSAVVSARLPSGQNPLQQLVLIIADGRFHEKEKLKRCVRDAISRKRMVAFLLVDSPEESIMDLEDASFVNGNVEFSKYLDSFPFPYYIVLKNIEGLPRTLSDLLRQWFELMQYSSE